MRRDTITRRKALAAVGSATVVGAAGCLGDNETVEMRYGHVNAPDSMVGQNAENLADAFEERTDGRVTMEVFHAAELGDSDEIIEGVGTGTIDMAHNTWAGLADLKDELSVFDHPYIYDDIEHALRAATPEDSPLLREFNDELVEDQDVRVAGSVYYGYRHTTVNEPAYHPSDFEGRTIRAIPWDVYMAAVRGLGATPEPVAFAELASALATGVVDGQENPLPTIEANAFYEHQDYLILTGHILSVMPIFMNIDTWNQMANEDQETVANALVDVGQETFEETVELEDELVDDLADEGMEVIGEGELDMEAFEDAAFEECQEEFPEWYDEGYVETILNT